MKHASYILTLLIIAALATSCTKDFDVDYRPVTPFYVVQGSITDEPVKVMLTQSRNMNDSVKGKGLDAAQMFLSDDLGKSEQLVFSSDDRCYHSPTGWSGEDGRTYTLSVLIDGNEYRASSTMMPKVELDSIKIFWEEATGMKMMLMKYSFSYPKDQDLSYTYFIVTKNGNFYRSHAEKQLNAASKQGMAMVGCTTEKVMQEDDPEKQDAILHEGDKLRCELWTIDRPIYDYFFSIVTSQQNATNPLPQFTGGLAGYFSAHHTVATSFTFSFKDVK